MNNKSLNKVKKIGLIGSNQNFSNQLELNDYKVFQYGRNTNPSIDFNSSNIHEMIMKVINSEDIDRYIILSGFLQSKKITEQNREEINKSIFINSIGPILFSEYLLRNKPNARLIIIGSESGFKGSYDLTYGLSKSSIRMYVKQKKVKENQQILLISPSTIEDFGMTERREDKDRLSTYRQNHPKKRFLYSKELSTLIINLFNSTNFLTNEEINLNGGKFSLME